MAINPETAVSYAALILADEGVEITPDKLQSLLQAAGVDIQPIWSVILSKTLKDKDIKQILTTVVAGETSCPGAPPGEAGHEKVPGGAVVLDPQDAAGDDVGDNGSESGSDIGLGLFDD